MTFDGKAIMFDMDGVLYRGTTGLPFAGEAVSWARGSGLRLGFITNNSTRTPQTFIDRLAGFGIESKLDEIMTSALATAEYIRSNHGEGGRAFLIGMEGIREALKAISVEVIDLDDDGKCDYVVVGMSPDFNYKQLVRAQQEILVNGAVLIGTNPDKTYPWNDNTVRPGGGTLVKAVETCTDVKAVIIGKPEMHMINLMLSRYGVRPGDCLMVGDRLGTDILMGNKAGLHTLLVLTGISTREEAATADGDCVPDFVIDDMGGFRDAVESLWGSG